MDGNNRWSNKNNISKFNGYKKGSSNLIKLSNFIFENTNIKYISAFALSKNNLNRSKKLISTLKKVFLEFLDNKLKQQHKKSNFNIKFIGDRSFLNSEINEKVDLVESLNREKSKSLIIYINYSGKEDIRQATIKYHLYNKNNKNKIEFEDFLLTRDIPDPDILIRTGGYKRLSDFLLYQSTFTEFFFINKLWPDLHKKDLLKILEKYHSIERKFGL